MNKLTLVAPPDKSISHRALLFNAFSGGTAKIANLLLSYDTLATIDCIQKLGCRVSLNGDTCSILGIKKFWSGTTLDCKNSGTTMRLLIGLLSGIRGCDCVLTGDESLSSRPMKRVVDPLVSRGADIVSTNDYAPITVFGQNLKDFKYTLPIASAQVKSAILLSGLRASGDTTVIQPIPSRDHTEIMLKAMGADILIKGEKILLNPSILSSLSFCISGDISSASFWMVLAAIKPNCEITINNVNINPTRAGILDVFDQVGVEYSLGNIKSDIEKVADISVKYTKYLKPFVIDSTLIPRLIDEIPILSLLACFCQGQSLINDCSELRVKESDRIASIVECLSALGANIEQKQDSLTISQSDLHGDATVQSYGDHRIALTMEIANLILGNIKVVARECIGVSYPQFFADLEKYREIYK